MKRKEGGEREREEDEEKTEEGKEDIQEEEGEENENKGREVEAYVRWPGRRNYYRITVDNSELAAVLCGHSELKIEHLRPYMERITNIVQRLSRMGWDCPGECADPVLWVPRELNKAADAVCNLVMNRRLHVEYRHPRIHTYLSERCCIKISSDGGCRGGKVSATGWTVWAVRVGKSGEEVQEVVILKGGKLFDIGMASLEIETRALHECLESLIFNLFFRIPICFGICCPWCRLVLWFFFRVGPPPVASSPGIIATAHKWTEFQYSFYCSIVSCGGHSLCDRCHSND